MTTKQATAVGGPDDGALPPGRRAGNIGMSVMWLGTLLLGVGSAAARALGRSGAVGQHVRVLDHIGASPSRSPSCSSRSGATCAGSAIFVVMPVLLTLGLAVTVLYTDAAQLVPALKSYWLVIHVSAAVICGGAFCVAATVTLLFLVADAGERRAARGHAVPPRLAREAPARVGPARRMAYRIHAFMFPLWTFAVVAGAIWAENAWGRYWGWDPKETWAFITWVAYAAYLHARATAGWKGRKAAVIALVAFGCFLFNYFGVNMLVTGLHSYSGV